MLYIQLLMHLVDCAHSCCILYTVHNTGQTTLQFCLYMLRSVSLQAMEICVARKWGEANTLTHLFEQLDAYRASTKEYQRSLAPGGDPDEWWEIVGRNLPQEVDGPIKTPAIISTFSRMLLCYVPHAAEPERAFSAMNLDHTPLRSRFSEILLA